MTIFRLATILCAFVVSSEAQLTLEQKINDFEHLASTYAKQYGPYEWKRDTFGFDLLDIAPWLTRVGATKDDLEFYDLMSEYVSQLNDAHDTYQLPSSFIARLNFTVDIYDGKVLIDSINRQRLPASEFPFQVGDEVVSVDGKSAEEWIAALMRYQIAANPRSTRRLAASLITTRPQQLIARAIDLGIFATVVTRDEYGATTTHFVPWAKTGLPLTRVGPVPSPNAVPRKGARGADEETPDYMTPLLQLQNCRLPERQAVLGFGARAPIFALPPEFQQRLPRNAADVFTSGVFQYAGYRIGFIRIPNYGPANLNAAVTQFVTEIQFFEANTDGLIVDQMRNPGGSVSYVNTLLQFLIPYRFRTLGFELRATSNWVLQIASAVDSARAQGTPSWFIALLEHIRDQIVSANHEYRGRTGPIPLDDVTLERDPAIDPSSGRLLAYTKPLMVLSDEMSASGADMFPASIQDNARGPLFGMRTMGAGGNVVNFTVGNYTEGVASLTQSLMVRKEPVNVPGYPSAAYVENIGVHPDIVEDYMTRDNLMQNGRPFVNAFLAAMADHISRSR